MKYDWMQQWFRPLLIAVVLGTGWQAAPLAAQEADFAQLNEMLGRDLFQDDNLWNDADSEVAARLWCKVESKTEHLSSYRRYASPDKNDMDIFAGAKSYSLAIYGQDGAPDRLSIIFVNKGDFFGTFDDDIVIYDNRGQRDITAETKEKKRRRDLESDFKAAMLTEAKAIEEKFGALLGQPKSEVVGMGRAGREKVKRWDWKGHAFLLSSPREEYVGLKIMSSEKADNDGKPERVKDADLRRKLRRHVETRPSGDVVVTQIPMVNQGNKGFCVPATWERYLRYMGIPADMYVLAMAGGTAAGGGTNADKMSLAVQDLALVNGRQLSPVRGTVEPRDIKRYIDDGLPLMWCMLVDDGLTKDTLARTKVRKDIRDWTEWAKGLKDARMAAKKIIPDPTQGHMCMIIGYNEKTRELAISDSWGAAFQERWMLVEEAARVSRDQFWIIGL